MIALNFARNVLLLDKRAAEKDKRVGWAWDVRWITTLPMGT